MVLLVGLFLTYRQLRTTREGQFTERCTRAMDQLGHAGLDVRLGGIYALKGIARDSPADRATTGEVLTSVLACTPLSGSGRGFPQSTRHDPQQP